MGLQKEIWIEQIQPNLFKGAEFITASISHDAFVSNAKVNIPQSGTAPTVEKNRAVFPATITERTDAVLTYNLDNYSVDPIRVRTLDEYQTSYAKMESVLAEHNAKLSERLGDETAFAWATSGASDLVLRTTGDVATDNLPHATATGSRNKVSKTDIRRMARKLDLDNVPSMGRKLLMPVSMYYELFDDADLLSVEKLEQRSLPNGVINRLFGFDIMVRPSVVLYNEVLAGVKQAVGGTENATDCFGAIAWSEFAVSKALGSIDVYANEGVAEHYGAIVSAEVQFGASVLRNDYKGIVALAQGYTA